MTEPFYTWQRLEATLAGESLGWAGKPGLEGWDVLRPSTRLIAEELSSGEAGQRLLDLRCGAGVCGALAARRGADVTLCDDSLVAVEAARRTLALNSVNGQLVHGDDVTGLFDSVLLDAPRGREWVRHLLTLAARMLRPGGRLLLAGPNRGGIKGFIEDAREIVGPCMVLRVKASHRLAVAEKPVGQVGAGFPRPSLPYSPEICEATVRGQTVRFVTQPGVFSSGELDTGTRALIETMVIRPGESVLDLGCGCGVVGAVAARMGGQVVCVDSSAAALQATRATLELNGVTERAHVLASDCASAVRDRRFGVIATNPPFHQGLGVEYDVARQFVRDAAHLLIEGDGRLYLVANRFIRYERMLGDVCVASQVTIAYEDSRFRVLKAAC
jgi:16S rRNA (guanine1207-N2)-methyltransferase